MGILHHPDDVCECCVLANFGGFKFKAASFVERAADDLVANLLLDRHRFARNHRLVDSARPRDHLSINGNFLTRTDNDHIIGDYLFDREINFLAVADHASGLGLKSDQLFDGLRGPALGLDFQSKTEDDERDDNVGDIPEHLSELHVRKDARRGDRDDRVGIGRTDPDRDQRVHICRAMLERIPQACEELRSRPDHHWQAKYA